MNPGSENKQSRVCRHLSALLAGLFAMSVLISHGQIDTTGREMKERIDSTDQEPENLDLPKRFSSIFGSDDILEISLQFDVAKFLKKAERDQSIDGSLTMHFSQADSMERKVTVKYRGQSRFERCRYPPARITFKKPLYEASDTGRIKNIKLVNQCQPGSVFGDYIIREYLVYKLYNVLTDTSFRVRLVSLNLVDSEEKRKTITQYGILIEPEGLLEQRLNLLETKTRALSMRHMNPSLMDRIGVFNYMVSNWDWSVPGQHNISVFTSLSPELAGKGVPVPFDFDLTGVVNADYAIPPDDMEIETNRDRLFSGICRTREEFQNVLMTFLGKKEEFYSVINDFPYLSKGEKKDITAFLDQFFDQLEKPKSLERLIDDFLGKCKDLN